MNQEIKMSLSGTQRLIRTACKGFHHKGSQQCGNLVLFRTFLKKKGIHTIPLARFVGNRFNVVFYDAAGIYYLREEFIKTVQGSGANLLLKAVLTDIKNPVYLAGCRALGFVDKIVTGPLWRKLRQSDLSVIGLSSVYSAIKEKFDTWSNDAREMVTGLGEDFIVHTDEVWYELIAPSAEFDVLTQQLLQFLFKGFSTTTQSLLLDHLPGGIHHTQSENVVDIQDVTSVPTTNRARFRHFRSITP